MFKINVIFQIKATNKVCLENSFESDFLILFGFEMLLLKLY